MDNYQLRIEDIISKYYQFVFRNDNIIGIGLGNKIINGKRSDIKTLTVLVKRKLAISAVSSKHRIPKFINGVFTDVVELGELKFQKASKVRPAVGGISVGNSVDNTAGTIGYAVTDKSNKQLYLLSCSHVLTRDYKGELFDKILQPGVFDGGEYPDSYIGKLEKWVPVHLGIPTNASQLNEADAAIVDVGPNNIATQKNILAPKLLDGTIIKQVINHKELNTGDKIWKIGRSTGKTEGEIITIKTSMAINDPKYGMIIYRNVITTNAKSAPGDSGAIGLLKNTNKAFGMLIVGNGANAATFLPLKRALDLLEVQIAEPLI